MTDVTPDEFIAELRKTKEKGPSNAVIGLLIAALVIMALVNPFLLAIPLAVVFMMIAIFIWKRL
jgi:Flp pilus assembly protein TadB